MGLAAWTGISTLISLFAGGWIAARLAGMPTETDGMLHGIITWSLVTLITMLFLMTSAGRILSGVSSVLGQGLSLAGRAVGAAATGAASVASSAVTGAANVASSAAGGVSNMAQDAMQGVQHVMQQSGMSMGGNPIQEWLDEHAPEVTEALELQDLSFENILMEAQNLINQSGMNTGQMQNEAQGAIQDMRDAASMAMHNPAEIDHALEIAMRRVMRRAQGTADQMQIAREDLLNMIMARTGMQPEQAMEQLTRWEQAYERARTEVDNARQMAMQRIDQMRRDAEEKADQIRYEAEMKARDAARMTSRAIASAALAAFLAILVGAVAAGLGGAVGAPETIPTTTETTLQQ
jgi:hypothetical protein